MQPSNPKKFISRIDEAYDSSLRLIEYSMPTKIGYWRDNMALREEKMELIKRKRERCETLTIRINIMTKNLTFPGQLSQPNPYIHYGDAVQITTDPIQTSELGIKEAVLAGVITEKDIDVTVNLCHASPVLASHSTTPYRRNIFSIIDPKKPDDKSKKRLSYEQDVYICLKDTGFDNRKLYLQAIVSSFDDFGGPNEHYPLRLSECPDRYCKFKIVHFDPEKRITYRGTDVASNDRICIAHTATNRFLVVENSYVPTFFGAEMEVSCFNYKRNNREIPSNCWQITILKHKELIVPSS